MAKAFALNLFLAEVIGGSWTIVAFGSAKESLPSIDFHKTFVSESTGLAVGFIFALLFVTVTPAILQLVGRMNTGKRK